MSLIKFKKNRFPWDDSLFDFFNGDEFFNDEFFNMGKSVPAMNVKEHDSDFEIELAAPGFDRSDFEIVLEDNVLRVSAKKSKESGEEEEGYTRKEFNYSAFQRNMQLPGTVDEDKEVKATYKNGILKLKLMKSEMAEEKTKRVIEVV
ncbi:Hsp20/alpha crystallin family protein [Poritiphilus flavus]|uniref:Hsp20 family protein n=1 Tax=Poritiphilus flavus TaxID=2697053 RepID=A0A6L9EBB9_9FLAO|nr:Hsp20/alpha crystallin family protein [Poritiphilus flavus]NAS11933.1 Hsp20 family protein [Poritiphilus flavus]